MEEIRKHKKVDEVKKSKNSKKARKPLKLSAHAPVTSDPQQAVQETMKNVAQQNVVQKPAEEKITQKTPLLYLDHVSKKYPGDYIALDDVTLQITAGEFVAIIGVSGAGKSTLLKMIYAEEAPTEGDVYLNGRPVSEIKKRLLPYYRRNFGTVFQDFKLLPKKTIFENVAFALEVDGASNEQIADEVPKILSIVGLESEMQKYPYQVSGGEEQRASLARALIHRPKVLIADEPTGNLDPASSQQMIELLLQINELGTTIIFATHDKDVVDQVKRRVIVMDQGKVIGDKDNAGYGLSK